MALVQRLVAYNLEAERVVNLLLPGEKRVVYSELLELRVRATQQNMGDDWQASARAHRELWPVVGRCDGRRRMGNLESARAVYVAEIRPILDLCDQLRDEASEIASLPVDSLKGLEQCLALTTEPDLRQRLLREVFAVFVSDSYFHRDLPVDHAAKTILVESTTPTERARVDPWTRAKMLGGRGVTWRLL